MLDLSKFRAVIFDFDGVIVDSESMQARAWTRLAAIVGDKNRQISIQQIAGQLDIDLAAKLFPDCDASWCVRQKARIDAELEAAGELGTVEGIEPFVRAISKTHRLAICSSCQHELVARRLERTGLRSAFAVVVGRTEDLRHKPAPDLYLRAIAQLGVSAAEACAIEDSPTGIAAAKAAGLHVIQLVHPGMPRAADADEWIERLET
jgi:HAD superfamily hydrolase (TIGR01509 family)